MKVKTQELKVKRSPKRAWTLWGALPTIILLLIFVLMLLRPDVGIASDEFSNPSWTELPTPSAYNLTPNCPPTTENDLLQCEVPDSTLPPPDPGNPEHYLNSAYWPAEKRPDIEVYAIQRYGYNYQNCSAHLPHYCFLVDAEAVGYPVDHTPEVGDLWLAPCEALTWLQRESPPIPVGFLMGCGDNSGWYLGYVDQVFPDGSFMQSWGGSATPADSGLALTWFSGSMDPSTYFIHLLPPGSPKPGSNESPEAPKIPWLTPNLVLRVRGSIMRIRAAHVLLGRGITVTIQRTWVPCALLLRSARCSWVPKGRIHHWKLRISKKTVIHFRRPGKWERVTITARTFPFVSKSHHYSWTAASVFLKGPKPHHAAR